MLRGALLVYGVTCVRVCGGLGRDGLHADDFCSLIPKVCIRCTSRWRTEQVYMQEENINVSVVLLSH